MAHAVGRVPSRGGKDTELHASPGHSGSGILPLVHAGQAAGSRFHSHLACMEGGSGILPLGKTQPEPRRLCHVSFSRWAGIRWLAASRCGPPLRRSWQSSRFFSSDHLCERPHLDFMRSHRGNRPFRRRKRPFRPGNPPSPMKNPRFVGKNVRFALETPFLRPKTRFQRARRLFSLEKPFSERTRLLF